MSNTDTSTLILDAGDCLNRAKQILEFVIHAHTQDREQSAGLGWILAEIQTGIVDAMALLDMTRKETAP